MNAVMTTPRAARDILAEHRDVMVQYMCLRIGVPEAHAAMMIDQLPERLIGRMVKDLRLPADDAESRLDAGMRFLLFEGQDAREVPTPEEDDLWHTFLLYPAEYAAFCYATFGGFRFHMPNDVEGLDVDGEGGKCGKCKCRPGNYCSKCDSRLLNVDLLKAAT